MSSNYPASLDSFVAKSDGAGNIISAAHINYLQDAILAIETELGTDPAGSLTDLKTRLAVMLTNAGGLKGPQQIVTVAKSGGSYTTIQAAVNSISDAASNKIYTVLVFPGEYNEALTLKNYVNIVAIDPEATILTKTILVDSACHCYLKFTIHTPPGSGSNSLKLQNAGAIIEFEGNITADNGLALNCTSGTLTFNGNAASAGDIGNWGAYCGGGTLTIKGGVSCSVGEAIYHDGGNLNISCTTIECTYDNATGYGITIAGAVIPNLQNVKIICTHADAKSIYAAAARDVRCMSVWANRDDHANITQLIAGGFNFDSDVQ